MKIKRMYELNKVLNEANHAYYNESREIMSNYKYDELYDELIQLEKETGTVLAKSPTHSVGSESLTELSKDAHEHPALSLDKTKDEGVLVDWLGSKKGNLSWKLDGLTVVVTYDDGILTKAVTRGDGYVGSVITHNAKFFHGVPNKINYKGHLVVRGEAIITYSEFNRINEDLPVDSKYKNPRNLASGTVMQLDSKIVKERNVYFKAFALISADKKADTTSSRLSFLNSLGFDVVENVLITEESIVKAIDDFKNKIEANDFPSDGLVLTYEDAIHAETLQNKNKSARHSIAFKWADETAATVLREIEWSPSRTGLINPVAIFDPVELEGTTVSRASLHNLSVMNDLGIGIASWIEVYKANMIIPQVLRVTEDGEPYVIPSQCPACSEKTSIKYTESGSFLICNNSNCSAKRIGSFVHLAGREALNIRGLSEATIEKFIKKGFLKTFRDIYHLYEHKSEICSMGGFGIKSYNRLIKEIEKSREVKFECLLYALGIPNVGRDASKKISQKTKGLEGFVERLRLGQGFTDIDGIGEIINNSIYEWKSNNRNGEEFADLVDELTFIDSFDDQDIQDLAGKVFVITGKLNSYSNRNELKAEIESRGGKVTGSISKNTNYLINNDVLSTSSKNATAKKLNIPIISEEDYKDL